MKRRVPVLLVALAAPVLAAQGADEMESMLLRAGEGRPTVGRERRLAGDIYREWQESERVNPGTGDPALGRALEKMSSGRRLGPDEAAAAGRLASQYRAGMLEARRKESAGPAGGEQAVGRPAGRRRGRRGTALLVAGGAGLAVLVAGAAWIVVAGRLRKR